VIRLLADFAQLELGHHQRIQLVVVRIVLIDGDPIAVERTARFGRDRFENNSQVDLGGQRPGYFQQPLQTLKPPHQIVGGSRILQARRNR
jgi:hypothetical protein